MEKIVEAAILTFLKNLNTFKNHKIFADFQFKIFYGKITRLKQKIIDARNEKQNRCF
jgi:hypothetical protein